MFSNYFRGGFFMQIIHNFGISPEEYFFNGQDNDFPKIDRCPKCNDIMIKHGFYERFVVSISRKTYIIIIRRFKCKHCGQTVSILPSFLLPQFQRSLEFIFYCLDQYFLKRNYSLKHRQVHFYCSRFKKNIPGIISFFREKSNSFYVVGKKINKKAIKLIEMIKSCSAHTFSQRYHNHFNKDFMAL